MKRHALVLLSVVLLAGCATNRSNYYSYDGSGDYYYGAGRADVVIDSSGYYYGSRGYGAGYGYGAYGYGAGYGYGYGYPYSWWGYGYQPIWSTPSYPHYDAGNLRDARVERDRAVRSGLIRRDTVHSPDSAKWFRDNPEYRRPSTGSRRGIDAPAARPSSARRTVNPQSTAPIRQAPMTRSRPVPSRSAGTPTPTRSAPIPRPAQRRQ